MSSSDHQKLPEALALTREPLAIVHVFVLTAHSSDHQKLPEALALTRDTLAFVNMAVKNTENRRRLEDLQRRMDRKPIENSNHPLVANHKVSTTHSSPITRYQPRARR